VSKACTRKYTTDVSFKKIFMWHECQQSRSGIRFGSLTKILILKTSISRQHNQNIDMNSNTLAIIRQHCDLIFQEVQKLETTIQSLPEEERRRIQQLLGMEQFPVRSNFVTPTSNSSNVQELHASDDTSSIDVHHNATEYITSDSEKKDEVITTDSATQTDFHAIGVTNECNASPILDSLRRKRDASQFHEQDLCVTDDDQKVRRNKRIRTSTELDPCLVTPETQHHKSFVVSHQTALIPDTDVSHDDESSMDSDDMVCDNDNAHEDESHTSPTNQTSTKKRKPKKRVCKVFRSPKKWRRLILTHRLQSIFIN
jgi:hypothetical protein